MNNPERDYWLRGWREAEKAYERGQYLQVDPFETTYGMREAARYFDIKERAKARKFKKFEKPVSVPRTSKPWNKEAVEQIVRKNYDKPQTKKYSPRTRQDEPVNLNRLNKLNKKYRTVV